MPAAANVAKFLAKIIGLPEPKTQDEILRTFKIAGLAIINACIFYNVVAPIHNLPNLEKLKKQQHITWKKTIETSFDSILRVDYEAVFEIAKDIVSELPNSPKVEQALEDAVNFAAEVSSSRALLRHDLMGRIYHQLLFKKYAKHLATYYTSVPAAWLLSHIAIETPKSDFERVLWSDLSSISELRIIDPACGSGTLLSASYRTIQDLYTTECAEQEVQPDLVALHQTLLENVIWGLDVLSYALHMAVATLALHNPDSPFKQSNLYTTPLGVFGKPFLGSLELLNKNELPIVGTLAGEKYGVERVNLSKTKIQSIEVGSNKWDLVIMNPPFARSCVDNLLFGSIEDPKQRSALLQRYNSLISESNLQGIGHAGLAAMFVALAIKLAKNRGRLALVLPKVSLMGESWNAIRELLLSETDVDYIILSDESQAYNFSENTDLSETLLVATKKQSEKGEEPHKCVVTILRKKPRNEFEARILASILTKVWKSINTSDLHDIYDNESANPFVIKIGGEEIGEAFAVSKELLEYNIDSWTPLFAFTSSELNKLTYDILNRSTILLGKKQKVFRFPLAETQEMAEVGPDAKQIYTNFDPVNTTTSIPAFWGRQEEEVQSMNLEPNKFLRPKGNKTSVDNTLKQKSHLIIAQRLRSNTAHTLAGYIDKEILSNEWWTVIPNDKLKSKEGDPIPSKDACKIWTLWVNSMLGVLVYMAHREETMGGWIQMKKASLQRMPILDLRKLTRTQIDSLVELFHDMKSEKLDRLGNQFKEASKNDNLRSNLDVRLLKIITGKEVSREDLEPVYTLLASEVRFSSG
jgi:type I restriction-modification system DNA methylase subunit